jgi:hypothetical protein
MKYLFTTFAKNKALHPRTFLLITSVGAINLAPTMIHGCDNRRLGEEVRA